MCDDRPDARHRRICRPSRALVARSGDRLDEAQRTSDSRRSDDPSRGPEPLERVMVTVPYLDLRAQYHSIKPEIDAAVARVLESTQYTLGDEVAGFERAFAEYCQAGETIAVNSGTSALHLALLAAGVGPCDEVITVPFTFVATVSAVV